MAVANLMPHTVKSLAIAETKFADVGRCREEVQRKWTLYQQTYRSIQHTMPHVP
ncbi:hypothetical protein KIN20_034541 [Parelaphostrongylus tenuis]|uniref:Uncharacterized protein n=1 Tax=Parelaphostrongylus tenuis TaxID=148309 RepID=A0AAD5WJ25_PARTN|nr:hypothetical protein KIN20_034541 [Parelaphostrongylus tenuis]